MDTTGERIKNLRKSAGFSQEELASRLNVSRQTISKWESDQAIPESDNIVAICRLFKIPADTLFYSRSDDAEKISFVSRTSPDETEVKKVNRLWLTGIIISSLLLFIFAVAVIIFLYFYLEPTDGYISASSISIDWWFFIIIFTMVAICLCALVLLIIFRNKFNK